MSGFFQESYPEYVGRDGEKEEERTQQFLETQHAFYPLNLNMKPVKAFGESLSADCSGPGSSWKYRKTSDVSPLDIRIHGVDEELLPPAGAEYPSFPLRIPSPGTSHNTTPPLHRFRLSRSPLDSLQEEFKKYSMPNSHCLPGNKLDTNSEDYEDTGLGKDAQYMIPRSHADHQEAAPSVPDWSFVQRRFEVPGYPTNSDCPSLATGSTISSRNSSTRSARSVKWEAVEQADKSMCPFVECGRVVRDLSAHILTHQAERPEKCPIENCEYHVKGFARAYDRVRHTISHFKGTMVCGFCPGTPQSSFTRCDVLLKHLVTVHSVEHAPLARREELYRTGTIKQPRRPLKGQPVATCELCSEPFDAQGFYEHLRGCVLRSVTENFASLVISPRNGASSVEQNIPESKDSPRNDSVVTPVDENPGLQMPFSQERQVSPLDDAYSPPVSPHAQVTIEVHSPPTESKEIVELTASSRCLSLTSSHDDGAMKSSDEETDWTEDVGSPYSEPDAEGLRPMLSPVKRQLVDNIMVEFHRVFDKMLRTYNGGGGSGNAGYYSGSSGSSTYSNSSFISRKRSLSGGSSPPPKENGDDPHKRRRPDPKSPAGKPSSELRFACPYYKRNPGNPGRDQSFTSCRDPGFITVARLKEHLYRRHLLPIQCNRCCLTFPNDPTLREHQRDPRGCEIREQIPLEGFDKDQERKLKSKKRSLVYQSEEDKWKGVYRILFPDDNEADMPSPYIEYTACNTSQPGESTNVVQFQEFSRLELPRLVRRTLEVVVEEEAQPLEDKLKERLVDIVRECQTQLISMFQVTQAPNVNASELAPALIQKPRGHGQPDAKINRGTHTTFDGFDGFAVTESTLIPIPAFQYQDLEHGSEQSKFEKDSTEVVKGSPDSGYDSSWPQLPSNTHPVPQSNGLGQTEYMQQTTYLHVPNFVEGSFPDMGVYYDFFDRNEALGQHPANSYGPI